MMGVLLGFLGPLSPAKLLAVLCLALTLALGVQTVRLASVKTNVAVLQAAIETNKADASRTLAEATKKTLNAERELSAARAERETEDAKNLAKIQTQRNALMALSRGGGGPGLRDPNQTGCGSSSSGPPGTDPTIANHSAADAPEAGGLLSEPVTELLLSLVDSADQINLAYTSCRAYAEDLRLLLNPN